MMASAATNHADISHSIHKRVATPVYQRIYWHSMHKSWLPRRHVEVTELPQRMSEGGDERAMRGRQNNAAEVLAAVVSMVLLWIVRLAVAVSRSRHRRCAIHGWGCPPFAALVLVHFITCKISIASLLEVSM